MTSHPNFRVETPADADEVARLTQLGFAPSHAQRNIWQLRQGGRVEPLCLVAENPDAPGRLLGSIRFWPISIAGMPSVLLGPLAVDPELRGHGIGMRLVQHGLAAAGEGGWRFCFVSGEPEYYPKLGFTKLRLDQVDLPAPIEEERLHIISISGNSLDDLPSPWVIRPQNQG
jgi:predicted N-acetyltransferase YhbS